MGVKHHHKHKSKVSDKKNVLRKICGLKKGEVISIHDITQQDNS